MSAPLQKSSGAPVAQAPLKTGAPLQEIPLSKKSAAHCARHCFAPLAHAKQQAGFLLKQGISAPAANKEPQR